MKKVFGNFLVALPITVVTGLVISSNGVIPDSLEYYAIVSLTALCVCIGLDIRDK